MIKKCIIFVFGILHIFFISYVYGQEEIDEDDLFSDTEIIVNSEEMVDESIESSLDARSLSFSGSFYNTSTCTAKPDDFALKQYLVSIEEADTESQGLNTDAITQIPILDTEENILFSTTMASNILLDARLRGGIKGFINLDVYYYPQGQTDYTGLTDGSIDTTSSDEETYTDYTIKEAFADVNISRKAYFRVGKQVLQWGRGFFFNPTDLINIEKKNFMDTVSLSMDASREGTYGLKMHIPFGTTYNIYGFLNTGEDVEPDDFAWAGKIEVLYKDTEIALSGWTQKDHNPIYGLDFSTGIASVNVFGELSLSTEETLLRLENNYSVSRAVYTWIPRASIGFIKDFDYRDVDSRIILTGELYYNYAGYSENIFKSDGKIMGMFMNDLYEPNTLSKWYAFLMGSYREFIKNDINLFTGAIVNPVDTSFVILSGLNYNPKDDWTFDLSVIKIGGGYHSEYAFFLGNAYIVQLVSKWVF